MFDRTIYVMLATFGENYPHATIKRALECLNMKIRRGIKLLNL